MQRAFFLTRVKSQFKFGTVPPLECAWRSRHATAAELWNSARNEGRPAAAPVNIDQSDFRVAIWKKEKKIRGSKYGANKIPE